MLLQKKGEGGKKRSQMKITYCVLYTCTARKRTFILEHMSEITM